MDIRTQNAYKALRSAIANETIGYSVYVELILDEIDRLEDELKQKVFPAKASG